MLCKKPFFRGALPFGCGQCLPCRINRRRVWTHRMILESFCHSKSSFVTLTYSPKFLPSGATLVPRDVCLFLKRLRNLVYPLKLRYYLVGEYGDRSERPHYHLALFGLGVDDASVIDKAWEMGHTFVGDLSFHSAGYVAGYVTKGMTKCQDKRLNGRHPEFARMSTRPGIGAKAVLNIVKSMSSIISSMQRTGPSVIVPSVLKHGRKSYPLGRYLKDRIRDALFISKEDYSREALDIYSQEMLDLFKGCFDSSENSSKSLVEVFNSLNLQKVLNLESKFKVFSKKGAL